MPSDADLSLSKEEILSKYPAGSPDYPSHSKLCGCSACYASWLGWSEGHRGFELGRAEAAAEIAALREELGGSEDASARAQDQIDAIADALGDATEPSNLNDRGANARELAEGVTRELAGVAERLGCDRTRVRDELDRLLALVRRLANATWTHELDTVAAEARAYLASHTEKTVD